MKTIDFRKVMSVGRHFVLLLCLAQFDVVEAQTDAPWAPFRRVDNDYAWLQNAINDCGPSDPSGIKVTIQNGQTAAHNYTITLQCRKDKRFTHWVVDTRVVATSEHSFGELDTPDSKDLGIIYGLGGNTIIRAYKQQEP